jgi:hypothetical protein
MKVGFDVDVFNLLNASTATAATFASGPTFGYVTNVVPGRIGRVGARITF